jgi:hypothetical protein
MLTNQRIYSKLLAYLGIEPGNGSPDTDNDVLDAINAALQIMFTDGPYWMRKNEGAGIVLNPVTIQIGVTQGSTILTNGSQILPNMIGCMIRIPGEPGDNEIVDNATLLVPITQNTGTISGTVYFNSIILPNNVSGVSGNVFLDDTAWELQPYKYGSNQMFKQWPAFPVDPYYILQSSLYIRLRIGVPTGYYIVPLQKQTGSIFQNRLMIWPVPSNQHTLKWDQELMAVALSLPNLEIAGLSTNTPGTQYVAMPDGLHELVFFPLAALQLSSNPHFLEAKRPFVQTQADRALGYLKLKNPQRQWGAQLRPSVFMPA